MLIVNPVNAIPCLGWHIVYVRLADTRAYKLLRHCKAGVCVKEVLQQCKPQKLQDGVRT